MSDLANSISDVASGGVHSFLNYDDQSIVNIEDAALHQKQLHELQKYLVLVENTGDINEITAPTILAQISYGYRKSGEYAALAVYKYQEARAMRKRAEAIAFFDGFRTYMNSQKDLGVEIKSTDKAKEHYLNIDMDVIEAARKEALYEAMADQLKTIKMEFLMAISTTKAIAYGYKDSRAISGTSVAVNEGE